MKEKFIQLESDVIQCQRCPRLRQYCQAVAATRKKEFAGWHYWGKPVPGFGDHKAKIWIVGLAPAAHGANRTGRMFTGDSSGRWLYRALYQTGFANQESAESREDGLQLQDVFISATARCAPPQNKPLPAEILNCASYLDREFDLLTEKKIFLALGNIGFKATYQLLARHGLLVAKPKPEFGHNRLHQLGPYQILCSYHPSRQNTQTGLLTENMWLAIFQRLKQMMKK